MKTTMETMAYYDALDNMYQRCSKTSWKWTGWSQNDHCSVCTIALV